MAIKLSETFQINAPIEDVWRFLLTPERVVTCMPGAELQEKVDEQTFLGLIKVKVGPIVTRYQGRVQFVERDDAAHHVRLVAEGREKDSSGSAKGGMASTLRSVSAEVTEVAVESEVEVTGRVMQFGRGMIESVSQQLFQQFVAATRETLERPAEERAAMEAAPPEPHEAKPINGILLVLKVVWSWVAGFFRGLFGRGKKRRGA
jgi:carbon monoxide dehydrogenase subunit G